MSDARFIDPQGRVRRGHLMVLQKVGEQADGKIHMIVGRDQDVFHVEDDDQFFTAVFAVDPFREQE